MLESFWKHLLRVAVVVFLLVQIIGMTCIDWFMFHPGMVDEEYAPSSDGYVDIGGDGVTIAAVVLGPERGRKAIIRCHGNAESMYQSVCVLRELAGRGFTVASVDYPGYGLSSGRPTEEGCYGNVHRLYDWLVSVRGFDPKDIIVDGFSIGTGSAVELAATRPVGGLVLEAPFLSAPRAVTRIRVLPIDPFPNASRIRNGIGCPLIIIHGKEDRIVPYAQGEKLFELSSFGEGNRGHYRKFYPVDGADHGGIAEKMGKDRYLDLISTFAETICGESK